MKNICTAFFLLFTGHALMAQGPTSYWYFGYGSGVRFQNGTATAITNGMTAAYEGTASISDYNGNLRFYTDGNTIWNASHAAMSNGTGLFGGSHKSTTQAALIVPHPGNADLYYVFTVADQAGYLGTHSGISYSIVDMSQQSGLGAVTSKNVPLLSPTCEKVTAVYNNDFSAIWVATQHWGSNAKYVWKVTASGLDTVPVVTTIGMTHSGGSPHNGVTQGYMKFSADGSKLASIKGEGYIVELFDFNNATGVLSKLKSINTPNGEGPYGLEFSPDCKKLYATTWGGTLYQWDISSDTEAVINNSRILVHQVPFSPTMHKMLGIQLGVDNRIYTAMTNIDSLGVIMNPNVAGTGCNFVPDGFFLNGKACDSGLPNFIQSYFSPSFTTSVKAAASPEAPVAIFPNPFTSSLAVSGELSGSGQTSISVCDALGRIVYTTTSPLINGRYLATLDLGSLGAGTYFVRIQGAQQSAVKKIMKM